MNDTQIKTFLSLYNKLNFSKAAKELFITQSALSKQLKSLEDELGATLFYRNNKTVEPTDIGIKVHPYFVEAHKAITSAKSLICESNKDIETINYGVEKYMNLTDIFPSLLRNLKIDYPKLNFIMNTAVFNELEEKLDNNELEFVLAFSVSSFSSNKVVVPLIRKHIHLYYSDSLFPKKKRNITIDDFNNQTIILMQEENNRCSPNEYVYQIQKLLNIVNKNIIWVKDVYSMQMFLEAGLGFCIMGENTIITKSFNYNRIDLTEKYGAPLSGVDFVYSKSNTNPFISKLINEFK